jgi:hypothetical protein
MGLVAGQGRVWRGSSSSSNPSGGDDIASSPDAAAGSSSGASGTGMRLTAGLRSKSVITSHSSDGNSSYGNAMIPLAVLRQQQQYGAAGTTITPNSSSSYGNRGSAIKRVSEDQQF